MSNELNGAVVWRDDPAYEAMRRRVLWNRWTPDRYPDAIARVSSQADVVSAVRLARERDMRIAIRGGGHSFCGSPLRDGGMLIDLSRLGGLSIDPTARAARVQPAVTGRDLASELARHGLGFPVGHCGSVPMSGYLLAGGLGWNMGEWGPACFSVERIGVVTADAEPVSVDEEQNSDLLWAARGSGPGFFGVATEFDLALHPLPEVIRSSSYVYPLSEVEGVAKWADALRPALPATVEMPLILAPAPPGSGAPPGARVLVVSAAAFVDAEDEAERLLAELESYPACERSLWRQRNEPTSIGGLQQQIDAVLPEGHRYAADSFWSGEGLATLLPDVARRIESAPSPRSVVIAVPVPPPPPDAQLPDAAFSMVGRTALLCYSIWDDEADDDVNRAWLRETAASLEPRAIGHYIGEADLSAGPSRAVKSVAPPNWERLAALRQRRDPDGVFHTYLGLE